VAQIITRYGHFEHVTDPNSEWVTRRLLLELRSELYDKPDNEHTEVSVGNAHWTVIAQISGLVICDNVGRPEGFNSNLPETMYLRDIPDATLVAIWQALVREDQAALLSHPWRQLDELPAYSGDYYRRCTCHGCSPPRTDL